MWGNKISLEESAYIRIAWELDETLVRYGGADAIEPSMEVGSTFSAQLRALSWQEERNKGAARVPVSGQSRYSHVHVLGLGRNEGVASDLRNRGPCE